VTLLPVIVLLVLQARLAVPRRVLVWCAQWALGVVPVQVRASGARAGRLPRLERLGQRLGAPHVPRALAVVLGLAHATRAIQDGGVQMVPQLALYAQPGLGESIPPCLVRLAPQALRVGQARLHAHLVTPELGAKPPPLHVALVSRALTVPWIGV